MLFLVDTALANAARTVDLSTVGTLVFDTRRHPGARLDMDLLTLAQTRAAQVMDELAAISEHTD
ncbi:hypothetical protein [Actinokineospora inagensis]|uniref:hypothetical protein n=1 Tax=Actinokineospora inagensis TaxID=103730 RepID=UPI000401FFBB|nr:hypothetical protein [Actinokineospora inagensis]